MLIAAVAAPARAEVTITYAGPPVAIPDNQPHGVNASVSVAGLQAVVDVNVQLLGFGLCDLNPGNTTVAVTHPNVGDLVVKLTSPEGTTVTLVSRRGGARKNICYFRLDDEAVNAPLPAVTDNPGMVLGGRYSPEQPLSAFDGEDPNGIWTLNISDVSPGNTGTFRQFGLQIDTVPIDITVDQLDDPNPVTCSPGSCSLREAVQVANAQFGPNRIVLPAGTIVLTRVGADDDANSTGDLDITDDLVIDGAGAASTTVTQTVPDRVFHVFTDNVDLSLFDLTVTGGSAVTNGGALSMPGSAQLLIERSTFSGHRATRNGGAIYHPGNFTARGRPITLRDCRFEDNRATNNDAGSAYGGALSTATYLVFDTLLIENCTFQNNRADQGGGALWLAALQSDLGTGTVVGSTFIENQVTAGGPGGAIATGDPTFTGDFNIVVLDSIFEQNLASPGNVAGTGGALSVLTGSGTVRGSLFTGNSANAGGAIDGDVILLEDSTVCGNTAVNGGGGAKLGRDAATVARSTFCANTVSTADVAQLGGGAIAKPLGDLMLERSTLDGNVAVRGAGIAFGGDDLELSGNTIVAPSPLPVGALGSVLRYTNPDAADLLYFFNNILIGQCSYASAVNPDSALSNIESSGNTCRLASATQQISNQTAVAASAINLGPLTDHGGPTDTRMPQAPSIAINGAITLACTALDQRGFQRTDTVCDAGSVEVGGTLPPQAVFADGFE